MKEFDLVVVGSGVGLTVLSEAMNSGLQCCMIEEGKMGGTCLTRGCIPSKVLVQPADRIREAEHAKRMGLDFKLEKFDWDLISKRMWSQIDESKEMDHGISSAKGLTFYRGVAEFTGEYTMKVHLSNGNWSEEFKGKRFVLASGARSFIPPIPGLADTEYITTETFFGEKFPKKPWSSLIIIGGGVIAAEFAHIFSAFGTKVTIIEMLPRLVSTEEPEISAFLEQEFRKHMAVYTNYKAIGFRREKSLKVAIIEEVGSGKKTEVKAEEILVAVGRMSNADRLKVEKSGIQVDKKGWIQVNQFLETNKKNIWAIGDANGMFQFRHKANYDAEICVRNMFAMPNERIPIDYSAVPWAIFTYPQIGHVGMTQQEAIASGHEIYVAVKKYSSVAKGFAMGYDQKEEGGFAKLVVDKSYRILGAHVVGPEAAILVQQFVYLMNAGYNCTPPEVHEANIPKIQRACPDAGSFMPIYKSMVIHPSLNEVTGWIIGALRPVNIKQSPHQHTH